MLSSNISRWVGSVWVRSLESVLSATSCCRPAASNWRPAWAILAGKVAAPRREPVSCDSARSRWSIIPWRPRASPIAARCRSCSAIEIASRRCWKGIVSEIAWRRSPSSAIARWSRCPANPATSLIAARRRSCSNPARWSRCPANPATSLIAALAKSWLANERASRRPW